MERTLPIFNIAFNPLKSHFNTVSIVEYPASESNFIKFGKQKHNLNFSIQNEEKRIICGAVVVPNKLIYRYDDYIGEYYVKFSVETVEAMRNKWSESYWKDFTLDHEYTSADVAVVETWIKESDVNDKSLMYNLDEPIGTMFMSCKVNSDELWNQIKEGKYNGFSVEVYSGLELETPLSDLFQKQNKKKGMETIKFNDKSLFALSGLNPDGGIDKGNVIYNENKAPYVGEFEFSGNKYKTDDFGQVEVITKLSKPKPESDVDKRFEKMELTISTMQLAMKKQDTKNDDMKSLMESVQGIVTKLSVAEKTIDKKLPTKEQKVELSQDVFENINSFFAKFNRTADSYIK